jgi:hypothetical protein
MIRIWAVGGLQILKSNYTKVAAAHKTYSAERIRRCNLRQMGPENRSVIPKKFDDDGGDSTHVTTFDTKSISEEEALLMHDMTVTLKVLKIISYLYKLLM